VERRCGLMDEGLIACDSVLQGPHQIHFRTEPLGKGTIKVNTLSASSLPYTGAYYGGMGNLLEATPAPSTGYIFSHWEAKNTQFTLDSTQTMVSAAFLAADTVVAHFKLFSSTDPVEKTLIVAAYPTVFDQDVQIIIQMDDASPVTLTMYDLMGKQVFRKDVGNTQLYQETLHLPATLHSGLYLLRVDSGGATKTIKLIKQVR
jgi:hypothetical protein